MRKKNQLYPIRVASFVSIVLYLIHGREIYTGPYWTIKLVPYVIYNNYRQNSCILFTDFCIVNY